MQEKTLLERIRALQAKDYVYPIVFAMFVFIVLISFFFSVASISKHINKIFSQNEQQGVNGIVMEDYILVAQKLNIPTPISTETLTGDTPLEEESSETKETITSTETPTTEQTLDKKLLTLIVKNSTTKSGLAGSLAKKLEEGGFNQPKTGNEKPLRAVTTIVIKESKEPYAPLILEIVRATYPSTVIATTTEDALFDASIIIGTN